MMQNRVKVLENISQKPNLSRLLFHVKIEVRYVEHVCATKISAQASIFIRGRNVETKPWNKKSRKRKSIWKNMLEMIMGQQREKI